MDFYIWLVRACKVIYEQFLRHSTFSSSLSTSKIIPVLTFTIRTDPRWTKKENPDKINPMDITKEWTKTRGVKGTVTEKQEYIVNGTIYKVDGKDIILCPTEQEREVAAILSEKYGKHVEFVPQVMYPQGVQTPDYLVDGERFDLKSPTGRGKNLFYGMLAKKKKQSPNFIFDITDCPLSEEDVIRQIDGLYVSRHTRFVEKIVVMKNGIILKVYDRK